MVYALMWGGHEPFCWGIFSSPEAALIHLTLGTRPRGWHIDGSGFDRLDILDRSGGKTHFYVQCYHLDKLVR